MRVSPLVSVTVPVNWMVCAKELSGTKHTKSKANKAALCIKEYFLILPMCDSF